MSDIQEELLQVLYSVAINKSSEKYGKFAAGLLAYHGQLLDDIRSLHLQSGNSVTEFKFSQKFK